MKKEKEQYKKLIRSIIVILLVSFAPLLMGVSVAWYAHLIGFGVGYLAGFLKVFR